MTTPIMTDDGKPIEVQLSHQLGKIIGKLRVSPVGGDQLE